jgi:hypothetical protein
MIKLKVFFVVAIIINLASITFVMFLSEKNNERMESVYLEKALIKRELDSIKQEIFVWEIQLGRYEYMMEMVETENPELYKKIMHETE